jgi:ubiquinone/menaquinone biosynthesis C-methylase UbiE
MAVSASKNPLFYSIGSRLRIPYFLSEVDNLGANINSLDLGCGIGFFSSILADRGSCVYALDPDQLSIDKAKELYSDSKITFISSSAENIPLDDNLIDFFVCSEVLEHVKDLDKTLQELVRVSNDGAGFFITVPSLGIFKELFLDIGHSDENVYEQHMRPMFDKRGIEEILKKYNFQIEKSFYSKFFISEIFMGLTKIIHNLKKKKEISGQHDIISPPMIYKIIFPLVYFICRIEDIVLRYLPLPGHMIIVSGKIKK